MKRSLRSGFTLIEIMVAAALLGMSLILMFGFHAQAVRANMSARRLTDCTYLAQTQMERLLASDWTQTTTPPDLQVGPMTDADYDMFSPLEWPDPTPTEVNAANSSDPALGPLLYTVTWDVESMDTDSTWLRLRVRCTFEDPAMHTIYRGTTISAYRFRDS